jgi:hypothetical protein
VAATDSPARSGTIRASRLSTIGSTAYQQAQRRLAELERRTAWRMPRRAAAELEGRARGLLAATPG